jgi:chromosome segregation ATPase
MEDSNDDINDPNGAKPKGKKQKSNFSLRCFDDDAEKLKLSMRAMGPDGNGYAFGKLLNTLLSQAGLSADEGQSLPEIVLLKTTFERMMKEFSAKVFTTLDGFAIHWDQNMKSLNTIATATEKHQKNFESDVVAKDAEIAELRKSIENLLRQNEAISSSKTKTDRLIEVLEERNSQKEEQIQELNDIVTRRSEELSDVSSRISALEKENQQLEKKITELYQQQKGQLTALQTSFERLKIEEKLQFQSRLHEQLENERMNYEKKLKDEKVDLRAFYESRISELTIELNDYKTDLKARLNRK